MHIFLQGERNIGKSTIIRKTLALLAGSSPVPLGGFFTWKSGQDAPHVYIRPAAQARESEVYRLASWDFNVERMIVDSQVFEREGAGMLGGCDGARLLIMDELGVLESNAPNFRRVVLDAIAGEIPILGVLRVGGIPWHNDIKSHPSVVLVDVTTDNRDSLPHELADRLSPLVLG